MSNDYEFRHAAESEAQDFALIGFDLLDISLNLIGKDVPDRTRLINSLAEAAKLCFELQNLKDSMMELYKKIEGIS